MNIFSFLIKPLILLFLFGVVFSQSLFAYLDPGSGSFIIQMIVAGALGSLFVIKKFWGQIRVFFSGSKEEEQLENHVEPEPIEHNK